MKSTAPGTLKSIGEIKTALVDDHHEAFYWWWNSELESATLFHVDGHDDMSEAIVDRQIKGAEDYKSLNIANFICPAVHHGIISHIYWLNPHSKERTLLDYGTPKTFFSKRDVILNEQNYKYGWDYHDGDMIRKGNVKIMPLDGFSIRKSIPKKRPLILDIDLDAFCCHRNSTLGKSKDYKGALGFEERINQTMNVLAQLPKPDLITIASSQGDGKYRCYVPPFMVGDVSRYLALNLRTLYE
ncbi:MAG: UPF0489 family protein [Nanoarchaeota archaeon]|nr:UPF0489 family protein [Nanoarchaeota archaeon]